MAYKILKLSIWGHYCICAKEIGAHKATHMLKVNDIYMSLSPIAIHNIGLLEFDYINICSIIDLGLLYVSSVVTPQKLIASLFDIVIYACVLY